jgi:hypothetical protein
VPPSRPPELPPLGARCSDGRLTALVLGTALIDAYMPTAEAFVPSTGVSKNLDRGSTLANSLPVLD